MAVPLKTQSTLQTDRPGAVSKEVSGSSLEVVVLHTEPKETLRALKMAADLAHGLAPIRLLAVQVVPYPLSLDAPQVSAEFLERRFLGITRDAAVDAVVDIRLGRDAGPVIECGLSPRSVVVLGGRRRHWPTATTRLARRLERLGHQVVCASRK